MTRKKKSILKRIRRSEVGTRFTSKLMSGGIKWLSGTLRLEWIDRSPMDRLYSENRNFIFGYWHSDLILATRIGAEEHKVRPIVVMASPSRDGAMIAENMASQGLKVVRGSSGRDGAGAFRSFARELRNGLNGSMAVDGPKGPREEVKIGPVRLSQLTGVPLLPCAIGYRKRIVIGSWDHLRVPLPYSKAFAICGEPFHISREATPEEVEEEARRYRDVLMDLRTRLPYDFQLP